LNTKCSEVFNQNYVAPKLEGESCVDHWECDSGLICLENVCSVRDTSTPLLDYGEACDEGIECRSGLCGVEGSDGVIGDIFNFVGDLWDAWTRPGDDVVDFGRNEVTVCLTPFDFGGHDGGGVTPGDGTCSESNACSNDEVACNFATNECGPCRLDGYDCDVGYVCSPFGCPEGQDCSVAELGGNDAFWSYSKTIFSDQENNIDTERLKEIAVEQGVDEEAYQSCVDSNQFAEKVENDYQDGLLIAQADPQFGTPYSLIITKGTDEVVFTIAGAGAWTCDSGWIDYVK